VDWRALLGCAALLDWPPPLFRGSQAARTLIKTTICGSERRCRIRTTTLLSNGFAITRTLCGTR
jgi:hypothetical protein